MTHSIEQSPAAGLRDGRPQDPLPRDYGAINAVYAALLVGLVAATDGRRRNGDRISAEAGRTVTAVLATSAASDFMQAGFRALGAVANRAEAD